MSEKKQLHVIITTPLRTVYDSQVDQITVTTSEGEITVLPDHIPLVVPLKVGQAMVKKEGREIYHAIDGGILEVRHNNQVVILSDRSENASDIDVARAEAALKRAQILIEEKHHEEDVDYARVERDIAKELNRVKIAEKGQRK
ncbi:ATP synthase F1 subunit epsilon [Patescibacteria group bacterium]|nr:ATP synthase F1 subunit epsilon [Patescibacteria group bacterium]